MPASSLGSLSPVSSLPSPPAAPPMDALRVPHPPADPAALDSGSELSDLTEDDDAAATPNAGRKSANGAPRGQRRKRGIIPPPMWGWAVPKDDAPAQEEEEEDDAPAPMEEEEDDDEEGDDVDGSRFSGSPPPPPRDGHKRRASGASGMGLLNTGGQADDGSDEDDEDEEAPSTVRRPRPRPPALALGGLNAVGSDDDDSLSENDDDEDAPLTVLNGADSDGTESEAEDDDDAAAAVEPGDNDDLPSLLVVPSVTASVDALLELSLDMSATAPPVGTLPTAGSSIMAGSAVIEPPSPTSSASTSPTGTPTSSRSPTPAPRKPESRAKPAAAVPIAKMDSGASTAPTVTGVDAEDVEVDVDDEPDAELDSFEADYQPAHRAEALDALASLELKFALLRERIYVEKMEQLAWEEKLVEDGIHPELVHLQDELSRRRDKRLDLAVKKRTYEMATVIKRREVEEDAVWSTWKFRRDELQVDMIAEHNRKRRKLEREQKLMSRTTPIRRIPRPLLEVPPPPTLREIIKAQPFVPQPPVESRSRSRRPAPPLPRSYPELTPLSGPEIGNDLGLLYSHRRTMDYHRQLAAQPPPPQPQQGPPLGAHPYDPYAGGAPQIVNGGPPLPGYGVPPAEGALPPHLAGGPMDPAYGHPHPAHAMQQYHGRPPPPHHHHIPPGMLEVEPMHMPHEVPPPGYGGPPMRRSPSPPPGMQMHGQNGWPEELPRESSRKKDRERPRERDRKERERERDRDRERSIQMEMHAQQEAAQRQQHQQHMRHMSHPPHPPHPHPHPHDSASLPPSGGPVHLHQAPQPHHHHIHRHHAVHHHHHPPPPMPGPTGNPYPGEGPPNALVGPPHPSSRFPPPGSGRDEMSRPGSAATDSVLLAPPGKMPYWRDEPPLNAHDMGRERDWERERAGRPGSSHSVHSVHSVYDDQRMTAIPFVLPPSGSGGGRHQSIDERDPTRPPSALGSGIPTPPTQSRGPPNGASHGIPLGRMPPPPSRIGSAHMSPTRAGRALPPLEPASPARGPVSTPLLNGPLPLPPMNVQPPQSGVGSFQSKQSVSVGVAEGVLLGPGYAPRDTPPPSAGPGGMGPTSGLAQEVVPKMGVA